MADQWDVFVTLLNCIPQDYNFDHTVPTTWTPKSINHMHLGLPFAHSLFPSACKGTWDSAANSMWPIGHQVGLSC